MSNSMPSGWYFCVESKEVKPGQVVRREFFGQALAVWRTESGVLNISDAACPHLGSDLSKLGKVVGEHLQCFSHDYTYNADGDCVATGFKSLPCRSKQVMNMWPVHEVSGFVLVWYDANRLAPTWRIPASVFDSEGTSVDFVRSDFEFEVPVETLNEDNFDVGHLYKWHNVTDVVTEPVQCDGPTISIAHNFKRHSILFEKPLPKPFSILSNEITSRYSSTLYGHGLTASFIDVFNMGVHMQDLIWVTPISPTRIKYTTFLRRVLPTGKRNLAQRIADILIQPLIFQFSVWRLRQEHKIEGQGFWENQTRVENPILTEKERTLIEPYREWCKQFDPVSAETNRIDLKEVS